MKEQLYRFKEIKSENDLPKEGGSYWCVVREVEIECKFRSAYKKFDHDVTHWLEPIAETSQDEQDKIWKRFFFLCNAHIDEKEIEVQKTQYLLIKR